MSTIPKINIKVKFVKVYLVYKINHENNKLIQLLFKGGIPLKDDRRISILEKLFLYRL